MASDCGRAGMPSSHSCCQRLAGPETNFIKAPTAQPEHVANTAYVLPATAPLLASVAPDILLTLDFGEHGPPGTLPVSISILRI